MKLAYILTQYPKVSHTFIRREILGLERRGHSVLRISISNLETKLVDNEDIQEFGKTLRFFDISFLGLLANTSRIVASRPATFFTTLGACIKQCVRNEASILRELYYFFQATCLSALLLRFSIDHIHAHFGTGGSAIARWSSRLTGIPFSFTVHAHDMFDAPKARDVYGKVHASRFVVGVCRYTISQLYRWSSVDDWHKIYHVRCFPGADFLTTAKALSEECNTFVCVARLDPEKGQLILLRALQALKSSGRSTNVILIGDGRFRSVLEGYIARESLGDHVELTGSLDARGIRSHLCRARALVLPSFMEGLPVVIMEAFAQRRPVISTYIAGIPELVRPRLNGWLVPAGDVDALTEAMSEALDAPISKLQQMGDAGRIAVEQHHDEETEIGRLEELFRSTGRHV
jgi:glycosyltransferase involved in cell wall biosynthesis